MSTELKELRGNVVRRLSEFDKPLWISTHFGFTPIEAPRISKVDLEMTRDCAKHPHFDAADRAAMIRMYLEGNLANSEHPLSFAYKRENRKLESVEYTLHFIGAASGIAEAALVQSAYAILAEDGHKNLVLDLNCIGDKESIAIYERELANSARKSLSSLPENLRERIKEDIFELIRNEYPEVAPLLPSLPSAIACLTPQSRSYFKEVLEYIEALNIDFRLRPSLVGERLHSSHAIFAIKNILDDVEETLAVGYRYSRLSKRFGIKKEVPMTAINIYLRPKKTVAAKRVYKDTQRPKFYLIQLGRDAKMKSLSLIELLRQERIRVHHLLGKDKIAVQFGAAESLAVTHHIILGQKEALDGTATVRNVATRAQDTIPLSELPNFLKNLPI